MWIGPSGPHCGTEDYPVYSRTPGLVRQVIGEVDNILYIDEYKNSYDVTVH